MDRRDLLLAVGGLGALGLTGGALWQVKGTESNFETRGIVALPRPASPAPVVRRADFGLPGLSPYLTPNRDFYRIDTSLVVPRLDLRTWRLKIGGMVENPITLTYEDILAARLIERDVTLTCVSNEVGGYYAGNARWLGLPIAEVLKAARPLPGADAVKSKSVDGWTAGTPLTALTDPGRDAMFAIGMNGESLPYDHGFPVRMVVPGLYGYVSATKWVTELEVTRFDEFEAYWTQRGWAEQGPIKTQSRLELPQPSAEIPAGATTIAGVAWAQHRGISKVEAQIGDEPWRPAELAPWDNVDTWRQWRLTGWRAAPGTYPITVRAYDGAGVVQTEMNAATVPDGASGYHSVISFVV